MSSSVAPMLPTLRIQSITKIELPPARHKFSSTCDIFVFPTVSDGIVYKTRASEPERAIVHILRANPHAHIVSFPEMPMDLPGITTAPEGLVVEYCSGGDVLDHVLTYGPLDIAEVRRLGRAVLHAMAHMKQLGFAHCDIKPENVFIRNISGKPEFKLGDFGMVSPLNCMTPLGCAATARYGAPEALRNESIKAMPAVYDVLAADIWSLGIMLTAAFTGNLPWEIARQSDSFFEAWCDPKTVTNMHRARDILGLTTGDSAQLASVVAAMLNLVPGARPSIEDLLKHAFFCE
jgi:serine/threonine protein kinase